VKGHREGKHIRSRLADERVLDTMRDLRAEALNIPLDKLESRLVDLPRDREIVAYCHGPWCVLSDKAVARLREADKQARRLQDGLPEWRRAGLQVDTV